MKTKKCVGICGLEKPLSEFEVRKDGSKDGYRNQCRKCCGKGVPKEILSEGFKRCTKCKEVKLLSEFYNQMHRKIKGLMSDCKECIKKKRKENYIPAVKEVLAEGLKRCYRCKEIKSIEEFYKTKPKKQSHSNRSSLCKECTNKERKIWAKNNPEKVKKIMKKWRGNNKEYRKEYSKQYRENNPEKVKKMSEKWRDNNREYLSDRHNKYCKKYYKDNPHFGSWRGLLRRTLKCFGTEKEEKTHILLGYSATKFKKYIEKQFTPEMNWKTYGRIRDDIFGWSIDHIIPITYFKIDTIPSIVNELKNLRPMWLSNKTINGIFYEGNLNKNNRIKIDDVKVKELFIKYLPYLKEDIIEEYYDKILN